MFTNEKMKCGLEYILNIELEMATFLAGRIHVSLMFCSRFGMCKLVHNMI